MSDKLHVELTFATYGYIEIVIIRNNVYSVRTDEIFQEKHDSIYRQRIAKVCCP